jgi:hypothetical protein
MRKHSVIERARTFESLESRNLLAGNVTAEVRHSHELRITGDNHGNDIQIRQIAKNTFEISGVGTKINGRSAPFIAYHASNFISIRLAGGNDSIAVTNSTAKGGLYIDGGTGSNRVNISKVKTADLIIDTNQGDDCVSISSVRSLSRIVVDTRAGDDSIAISDSSADNYIACYVGANNDHSKNDVAVVGCTATTARFFAGPGQDSLLLANNKFRINGKGYFNKVVTDPQIFDQAISCKATA